MGAVDRETEGFAGYASLRDSQESDAKPQVAVVGMACLLPDAANYFDFWSNLRAGRSSIRRVPAERWRVGASDAPDIDPELIPWCATLKDINLFDHSFFGISAREARSMDPQQRLLLQETWHCIEDAGVSPKRLREGRTGVWVGVMANDYQQAAVGDDVEIDSYAALGSYDCILANRVSYSLGLSGPSLSVGAACASSNVALHLAKQALLSGECDYAIAAGVSLNFHPWKNISFARSHMLSPDGRCKTFDEAANGYVPGEGVTVLLLQRLGDAVAEGNMVHGVIAGTAVNHTGSGPMITAPRVEAQADVVKSALRDARRSPDAISYVEAHGTGTSLGDPIEIAALQQAFQSEGEGRQKCYIGSVKTNIGHLEAAAGMAGVIKVLLMMKHGFIPPTLNISRPNELIDFERSFFEPARVGTAWKSQGPRRAGISSFGFGGANSHVIVEEYRAVNGSKQREPSTGSLIPFVLSAKTPDSLEALVETWKGWLGEERIADKNLARVSATLLHGRESFPCRLGGMVRTMDDVKRLLSARLPSRMSKDSAWTLVIGDRFPDLERIRTYFSSLPDFTRRWEKELADAGLFSGMGLDEVVVLGRNGSPAQKACLRAGMAKVVVGCLRSLGIQIKEVCGIGDGSIGAIVASGALSSREVSAKLSEDRFELARRPSIPLLDSQTGGVIAPYEFGREYLERLAAFELGLEASVQLLEKGRRLLSHQHTFKRYFREWREAAAEIGVDLDRAVEDFQHGSPVARRLVTLAMQHCLVRLREKWQLPELELGNSDELLELVALLLEGGLTISMAVGLLSKTSELESVARQLNQRAAWGPEIDRLPLLKQSVNQGQSLISARRTNIAEDVIGSREQVLVLGGGVNLGGRSRVLHLNFSDEHEGGILADALRLWLEGAKIDWQPLIPEDAVEKVRLPTYRFMGKPFWLKKKVLEDVSDSRGRRLFTRHEPVISDHQIGPKCLIPAAAMVDLILSSQAFPSPSHGYEVEDFKVMKPCPVDSRFLLEAETTSKGVSLQHGGEVVASGRPRVFQQDLPDESAPELGLSEPTTGQAIYQRLKDLGYGYGSSLRPLVRIYQVGNERWGELGSNDDHWDDGRAISARLLDGVFQFALLAAMESGAEIKAGKIIVPCAFSDFRIVPKVSGKVFVRSVDTRVLSNGDAIVSLRGVSGDGKSILSLEGLILKQIPKNVLGEDEVRPANIRYRCEWVEVSSNVPVPLAGTTVVLGGDEESIGQFENLPGMVYRGNYREHRGWLDEAVEVVTKDSGITEIYWLVPSVRTPESVESMLDHYVFPCFELARKLVREPEISFELIIVSAGAVRCEAERVAYPVHGLLYGLVKTLSREHDGCRVRCVDLDPRFPIDQVSRLRELPVTDPISEFCFRGEEIRRKVLVPDEGSRDDDATRELRPGSVCLLAGGAGGLGRALAAHLFRRYGARLILLGRSRPSRDQEQFLEQLRSEGAEVIAARGDLAQAESVVAVVREAVERWGRVDAVFHCAGHLADGRLGNLKREHFQRGFAAKVEGTINLYESVIRLSPQISHFVLYSSILTLDGNAGQAGYLTGCCFQDAFAIYLRQLGVPAQVINWGRWADTGSVARGHHREILDRMGYLGMGTEEALNQLDAILASGPVQTFVSNLTERKRAELLGTSPAGPAVTPIAEPERIVPVAPRVQTPDGKAGGKADDVSRVLPVLQDILEQVMESPVEQLDLPLREMGVDSILGVEFVAAVNERLNTGLNPTVLYDYSTLEALAKHILDQYDVAESLGGESRDEVAAIPLSGTGKSSESLFSAPVVSESRASMETEADEQIAIIGMSARYGDADSVEEYWRNLREGRVCIREVPEDHWGREWYSPNAETTNRSICKWGGFLRDGDRFDSLFFNISPADAAWMDPQQRVLLQECWRAFENAGYPPSQLKEARCGVFVGVMSNDYQEMIGGDASRTLQAPELVGNSNAILAARISYHLNLRGPALALDTACSSSLVAMHYAANALRQGEVDLMLVGGVTLYRSPGYYVRMSKAGMLSPTGRCWTFDERADGYVPGEGCGVVILKRLSDALRDGDHIHAVIRGSALNQDGRTNGITAPSAESQKALLREVYQRSGINPESLGLLEAHGTGTRLGDPIEFNALTGAFREFTQKSEYCAIGSAKANIGHTLAAAGMAGVIKSVLCLSHRKKVPLISYEKLNEHINLETSPFYIPAHEEDWSVSEGEKRRVGVSSFGFSGTNAHAILEEAPVRAPFPRAEDRPVLIVLSARDQEALKRRAHEFAGWWQEQGQNYSLSALEETLLYRRVHFECRFALMVTNREDLWQQLNQLEGLLSEGAESIANTKGKSLAKRAAFSEIATSLLATLSQVTGADRKAKLAALGELYLQGWDPESNGPSIQRFARVPLPGYAFGGRVYSLPVHSSNRAVNAADDLSDVYFHQPEWSEAKPPHASAATSTGALLVIHLDDSVAVNPELPSVKWTSGSMPASEAVVDRLIGSETFLDFKAQVERGARARILVVGEREPSLAPLIPLGALYQVLGRALRSKDLRILYAFRVNGMLADGEHWGTSGLSRSLRHENQGVRLMVVAYDSAQPDWKSLQQEFDDDSFGGEICWSHGVRERRFFRRILPSETQLQSREFHEDVVLITGGMGGLGLLSARHFLSKGAQVVLTGRRELDDSMTQVLHELGANASYQSCDLASAEATASLIAKIQARYGRLDGIVHSAGINRDALLLRKTDDEVKAVFEAKVAGLQNLHHSINRIPLKYLVLYSSISATTGNFGQADYASANAFMDTYAQWSRDHWPSTQTAPRCLSINWPYWNGGGMKLSEDGVQWLRDRLGLVPLEINQGLAALDFAMASGLNQVVVSVGDLSVIESHLNVGVVTPKEASQRVSAVATSAVVESKSLKADGEGASVERLTRRVKEVLVDVLKVQFEEVDEDTDFELYGIDSISMIGMLRELESRFDVSLHPVALQEHSSVGALVAHLRDLLPESVENGSSDEVDSGELDRPDLAVTTSSGSPDQNGASSGNGTVNVAPLEAVVSRPFVAGEVAETVSASASSRSTATRDEAIAVVGMSCRFPDAHDVEAYWENLVAGKTSIAEIPRDRWDVDSIYDPTASKPGTSRSKWGGFLGDITTFDAEFFKIKEADAVAMDPQQRILLELSQHLLDHAGYRAEELRGSRTAVIVGATESPYVKRSWQRFSHEQLRHVISGTIQNMLAARIADFYDLDGLAQVMDTACSSSLVTIEQGCAQLRSGAADAAICGGIELLLEPFLHVGFSQSGVLSPTDRCHVFDQEAKGIVLGEGAGLVMLKRLSDAEAAGDRILAVVRGGAVNNDGRTVGLTVPNPSKQRAVIESALGQSGISADEISYLEAHGTGTLLGDPIEIQAASEAYRQHSSANGYCGVGSVKSNIGHLLHAAGIAGFIKLVLSLQHKTIPPTLHCATPHPRFGFEKTPFYPVLSRQSWEPRQGKRVGAISSLGFGGTNCHLIVEEAMERVTVTRRPLPATVFNRRRFWLPQPGVSHEATPSDTRENRIRVRFACDEPYIRDHEVHGRKIVLGMTHLALALHANAQAQSLRQFFLLHPLEVEPGGAVEIDYTWQPRGDGFAFECRSRVENEEKLIASGQSGSDHDLDFPNVDLTSYQSEQLEVKDVYSRLASTGIYHGPALQTIQSLYRGRDAVLSVLQVHDEVCFGHLESLAVHPALLDGAIASCFAAVETDESFIPLSVKSVAQRRRVPLRCYSLVRNLRVKSGFMEADISLHDEFGEAVLVMQGVILKSIPKAASVPAVPRSAVTQDLSRNGSVENKTKARTTGARAYLVAELSPLLPEGSSSFDPAKNFLDLGMSSNDLVLSAARMADDLGVELYPTVFFEHSNLDSLVGYFEENFSSVLAKQEDGNGGLDPVEVDLGESSGDGFGEPAAIVFSPGTSPRGSRDIAIIGMAGRFARSKNLDEFWHNLREGVDMISEIPSDHFDYRPWFDAEKERTDSLYCKWGSFIEGIECFDAEFFNISPREAAVMDPQLRLLLQVMYSASEDAGYPQRIRGTNTGVFTGVCFHDFQQEFDRLQKPVSAHDGTGNAATMLANRPSFYFNLRGPSLAVDTACSSSLVALHQACRALQNGECDLSFAAGVNLLLSSWHYRYFCSIGALSHTGRCHTFDAAADGYVPGEGVAAVLLKPLEQALADGDRIHAVIKGTAVNHGGYTPSITAPSIEMEAEVLRKAWQDAGIDPATLGYIEAHGTGTKLGDPIEIEALKKAFASGTDGQAFCAVGSAKAHIGHTEGAAGIAGVIKSVLSMKHGEIPAMPKFSELNPFIKLEGSPLRINRELEEWERRNDEPYRAGVSSFGFGGTYSHVVLEEAPFVADRPSGGGQRELVVLSAVTEEGLSRQANELMLFLGRARVGLSDLAYTLQVGREQQEFRWGVVVDSKEALQEALKEFAVSSDRSGERIDDRSEAIHKQQLEKACQDGDLDLLQRWWLEGHEIPWPLLHRLHSVRIVSAPGYSFAEERHWPEHSASSERAGSAPGKTVDLPIPDDDRLEAINRYAGKLVALSFKKLGVSGSVSSFDDLLSGCSIHSAHVDLVRELVAVLVRRGYWQVAGQGWSETKDFVGLEESVVKGEFERLLHQIPEYGAYLRLTHHCGQNLHSVLAGKQTATDLLFSDGADEWVKGIYTNNPLADECHQRLGEAVRERVRALRLKRGGEKVRILEIGAGTGATTEAICAGLKTEAEGLEYVFSDVAATFVKNARQRWESLGFLKFECFDVEQEPNEELGKFDIVIGANVLHAVADLRGALGRIRGILRSDGQLFINEAVRKQDFLTLTFGLLSGWWRFADAVERLPGSPLLSANSWKQLLGDLGFVSIGGLGAQGESANNVAQEVIYASTVDVAFARSLNANAPKAPDPKATLSALLKWLRAEVASALGTSVDRISDTKVFSEMGVDSIVAIEFTQKLNAEFGLKLKTNVIFDYPNLGSLAEYLAAEQPSVSARFAVEEKASEPVRPLPLPESRTPERATPTTVTMLSSETGCEGVVIDGPVMPDQVAVGQMALPACGDQQILVQVKAAALNYGDILCAQGIYPRMPAYPFVTGFEFSGFVVACGAKVTGFRVGEEVFGLTPDSMGGHGQIVVTDASLVMRKPDGISHEEATTLPVSWCLMRYCFQLANPVAGETVLIYSAAGGNGLMAIRLAEEFGCRVIAVTGSAERVEFLSELGVQAVVNHRAPDASAVLASLVGEQGVQVVINTMPGAARGQALPLLRTGARFVDLALSGSGETLPLDLFGRNRTLFSVDIREVMNEQRSLITGFLEELHEGVESGRVHPLPHRVFPFEQATEAFSQLAMGVSQGKVVLGGISPAPMLSVPSSAPQPMETPRENEEMAIAVVGMSGRFPGAKDLAEFWENLAAGRNCITEVPTERWDLEAFYDARRETPDRTYCRWGGFLDDIDQFDPVFFGMTGKEAEFCDPQQRLFLRECWKALEDAGMSGQRGADAKCGVFVGVSPGDYFNLQQELGIERVSQSFWGNDSSILAARISYFMNLKGPSIAVNTACSSSLVAIHLACQSLLNGETDVALAGGTFVCTTPTFHILCSKAGMLSPEGKCKTFDASADGFVPGEGVGVIVLKRLSQAQAEGDQILGVIRGTGINQDGRTNGITAPSVRSQTELECEVYERARTSPETISYIEAHGTGTKLGDPIEIEALTSAFERSTTRKQFCAIGSVKTNIGHAAAAAGIAGVLKVLLCFRNGKLPPSLHFENQNDQIDFAETPFFVNGSLCDWLPPEGQARRAAVSSFGFSGTNAHLVLEEGGPEQHRVPSAQPELILLSAPSQRQLIQRARDLQARLLAEPELSLGDVSFTLAVGRRHFAVRSAWVVHSIPELVSLLGEFNGDVTEASVEESELERALAQLRASHGSTDREGRLRRLASGYAGGFDVDWESLFDVKQVRMCSLPTYPFNESSFWLRAQKEKPVRSLVNSHRNGTLITETLDSKGLPFRDHIVDGRSLLPGTWMIQAAVRAGTGSERGLRNVRFLKPLLANGGGIETRLHRKSDDTFQFLAGTTPLAEGSWHAGEIGGSPGIAQLGRENGHPMKRLSGAAFYQHLGERGYQYGESLRLISNYVSLGDQAEATLEGEGRELYQILDAAIQVAVVLDGSQDLLLLAEIDELALTSNFAHVGDGQRWIVRVRQISGEGPQRRFDIELLENASSLVLRMKAVTGYAQTVSYADDLLFAPVWRPGSVDPEAVGFDGVLVVYPKAAEAEVSLVAETFGKRPVLRARLGQKARKLAFDHWEIDSTQRSWEASGIEQIVSEFARSRNCRRIQIVFVSSRNAGTISPESIFRSQQDGLLPLCRFLQGMLQFGADLEIVRLVLVLWGVSKVQEGDVGNPLGSELGGFLGCVRRELAGLKTVTLDFEADAKELPEVGAHLLLGRGEGFVALRDGAIFERKLVPARLPRELPCAFREEGVYVILGGAGGIGLALSEYLLRTYQARLLLLGRSKSNASLEREVRRLQSFGGEVVYASVDAAEPGSLDAVIEEFRQRHGQIHGAIHSAIVLADRSLESMDETSMQAALDPKTLGCFHFADAFKDDPLDFMVFFSSMLSFTSNVGQSNYAAACGFEDAFGAHLNERVPYPVTVINWGYWSEIGIVANERYAKILSARGIKGIKTTQGIEALERILAARMSQVLVLNAESFFKEEIGVLTDEVFDAKSPRETHVWAEDFWSDLETPRDVSEDFDQVFVAVDAVALKALQDMPAVLESEVVEPYRRLHAVIRETLEAAEPTDVPSGFAEVSVRHPEMSAYVELLQRCMAALPDVLRGEVAATDVVFPDGSLDLVARIYSENRIARYFNDKLAVAVERWAATRKSSDDRPLRILEIGAGTGGTTEPVFAALDKSARRFEYTYTDVSPHFIEHGRRRFDRGDATSFRLLDIERDVIAQGFDPGQYDLVIASNVLHATADISQTVLRAKSLLREGGGLLINEVASVRLITTLTFGLLGGWWRFADPERRLPGSPLLSPEQWRSVLEVNGFHSVKRFGDEPAGMSVVQDVFVGISDGVSVETLPSATKSEDLGGEPIRKQRPADSESLVTALEERVIDSLVEALRLGRDVFDRRVPFADFGIDSITSVEVINHLNAQLGCDLRSTDIFNYPNIPALAARLVELGVTVEVPESDSESDPGIDELEDPLITGLNRLAAGEASIAETERLLSNLTR